MKFVCWRIVISELADCFVRNLGARSRLSTHFNLPLIHFEILSRWIHLLDYMARAHAPARESSLFSVIPKPAQNARKWFATVEIERMSCDPDWLDKAMSIVEKQIQEMNRKQRGKEPEVAMAR
jgi:hypothetical protein